MAPEHPTHPSASEPPAPPGSTPMFQGGGSGDPHSPLPLYSFGAAWDRGLVVFKANYPVLLGTAGIIVGAGLVDMAVRAVLEKIHPIVETLWAIPFALFVTIPLKAGAMLVGARAARSVRATSKIEDIFLGYARLGPLILWALLVSAVSIALMLPGGLLVAAGFMAGRDTVGVIVLIPVLLLYAALFLCLGVRFYIVPAMLVDPDLARRDIIDTARTSWRLTAGVWPSLLGLNIVLGVLMAGTLLLLCLGVVFLGLPIAFAVIGSAYAMLVNPLIGPRPSV